MIDPIEPSPSANGEAADLAALRDGCTELAIYLQRVASAIQRGQIGMLAHQVSRGESVATERQLPLIMAAIDEECGDLRAIAARYSGRLLAAQDFERAADLETRRREVVRPHVLGVDTARGRAIILPGEADDR